MEYDDSTQHDEQIHALQQQIVMACGKAWKAVKHILCDDSPEGHILPESDITATVDTKDVLSYSFRAIHESR